MTPLRVLLTLILSLGQIANAQQHLSASEARDHVGEYATVCGNAVGTHFASRSKGQPTFINLDKPYPNQLFTIVIFGSDRSKFGNPEQSYLAKRLCVTGKITVFNSVPEIVVHDTAAIVVQW